MQALITVGCTSCETKLMTSYKLDRLIARLNTDFPITAAVARTEANLEMAICRSKPLTNHIGLTHIM